MNRYGRGPTIGGPSKATATTLCQKCLKRGHYSYECKAVAQERPYVSRPSRTQQLLNPKLMPKLTSDVPQELLRKKGVADEQLAKAEQERGRKRERQSEDPEARGAPKRMRSASHSSVSVSTISTNMSRSPSPTEIPVNPAVRQPMRTSISRSPQPRKSGLHQSRSLTRSPSISRSPPRPKHLTDSEKKRRRNSVSSAESYTSDDCQKSRERTDSRSTRRRFQQISPPARGRRTESRSPYRGRRRLSNDRQRGRNRFSDGGPPRDTYKLPPRERSLSPFSKRLALTQAMNMSR
ncbi:hypothetical protein N431DRAFT_435131 [Stipitochalara longipes BDJ]|nr:hypothetical protein N431DRAFT_435131 [Stipitochalara longipes BDJ]